MVAREPSLIRLIRRRTHLVRPKRQAATEHHRHHVGHGASSTPAPTPPPLSAHTTTSSPPPDDKKSDKNNSNKHNKLESTSTSENHELLEEKHHHHKQQQQQQHLGHWQPIGRLHRKQVDAEASQTSEWLRANGQMPAGLVEQVNVIAHGIDQDDEWPAQLANWLALLGLPALLACLMLGLALCFLLRACRRPATNENEKKKKEQKSGLGAWVTTKKSTSSIIDFVSNGKLFASKQKAVCSVPAALSKTTTCKRRASEQRRKQSAFADSRQLTINMEEADEELDSRASSTTEDSDGRRHMSAAKGPTKQKRTKSMGRLRYSLSYDFGRMELTVGVLEARDLPAMDLNGFSDPYVRVQLLEETSAPDQIAKGGRQQANKQHQEFRTRIHKRTLNPVFNETFKFSVAYDELQRRTLCLVMLDYDRLSRHDQMGQVSVAMHSINLSQGQDTWVELKYAHSVSAAVTADGTTTAERGLGDLCLSLRYVPTAGKLNVVVLEARQLKKMDLAGLSDPYVKLALLGANGKRLKKKKTSIKKCTLNPHYNESFSFEIPFEYVQEVRLVVTVVDYDRIGTSEPIGKLVLGCKQPTGDMELRHWLDMLASPRRPIAQWHTLKDIHFEPTPTDQLEHEAAFVRAAAP